MVGSSYRTARTGSLILTSILCLGQGELLAQQVKTEPVQVTPTRKAGRQQRVLFDRVEGIIGDQVILKSSIDDELRAQEESGTPMTASERQDRARIILTGIAQDEIWVQYGKVIGGQSPEQFKAYEDRYVAEKMAEQEQRFGSFTRFNEELGNIGESRGALESQIRTRLLSDIGKQQALGGPRQRSPLMVTPKAMRRYFDQHPEQFSIQNLADYEWMYFPANAGDSVARMAKAATAWANEAADPEQIATQFGGRFRGTGQVLDDPDDDTADAIKNFALTASPGQISSPILLGRNYRLYKVTHRTLARKLRFSDPEVQKRIQLELRTKQLREIQNRVIQQNSAKLLIWPPRLRAALGQR